MTRFFFIAAAAALFAWGPLSSDLPKTHNLAHTQAAVQLAALK